MQQDKRAQKIAALNDAFRCSGDGIMMTPGTQALDDVLGLIDAVQNFDSFTEDNDPYREHDFGSLQWNGSKIFWKIDYYDRALEGGEDPLSPDCKRVLTVMLAEEY